MKEVLRRPVDRFVSSLYFWNCERATFPKAKALLLRAPPMNMTAKTLAKAGEKKYRSTAFLCSFFSNILFLLLFCQKSPEHGGKSVEVKDERKVAKERRRA